MKRLIVADSLATAHRLKVEIPGAVLAGEQSGKSPISFDMDNSPTALLDRNLAGKTLIHLTSSGTPSLVALKASRIFVGAFVALNALASHLRNISGSDIALLCTENPELTTWDEDTLFAGILKGLLYKSPSLFVDPKISLLRHPHGQQMLKRDAIRGTRDFDLCVALNCFDFVLRTGTRGTGWVTVERVPSSTDSREDKCGSRQGADCRH